MVVAGDAVRTPLGKGVVQDVRKNGRLVVLIGDRSVIVDPGSVTVVDPPKIASRKSRRAPPLEPARGYDGAGPRRASVEVDLHGLGVADALERVLAAVDAALLAGHRQVRLIHGRSGGRLRVAIHRQLRSVPSIPAFRLDPANEGVTIVHL